MKQQSHILAVYVDSRDCNLLVHFLSRLKIVASCARGTRVTHWLARNDAFDAAPGQRHAQFAIGRAADPAIVRSQDTRCVDDEVCSSGRSFI